MAQHVRDFAAGAGQWAGAESMDLAGLSPSARFDVHALAASLGLFTMSTGRHNERVLHVYHTKPEGWVPHVPKPKPASLRHLMPELYRDDFWAGGEREFIGDCADCGVELWGYDDERDDGNEDGGEPTQLYCRRCGGDTLSKGSSCANTRSFPQSLQVPSFFDQSRGRMGPV